MDLFDAIDALYRGEPVDRPPSSYMLNRFLTSDKDIAPFAHEFVLDIWDDYLLFEVWRALIPSSPAGAPYLGYGAPTKPGDNELVQEVMHRYNYNRQRAEEAVEMYELMDKKQELARHLGVDLEES